MTITVLDKPNPLNLPPIASFTASPLSGRAPLQVQFDAAASFDPDGTIISFDWETGDGATLIGFQPSYTYSSPGTYSTILTVTDNEGTTGTTTKTIQVNPINLPPQVDAGADQTITLPSAAILNGTMMDDGIPNNSTSVTWTIISGPGSVLLTDSQSPSTTVSFSEEGNYVLRLTANDGELTSQDEITITVNPAPLVASFVGDPEDPNLIILTLEDRSSFINSSSVDLLFTFWAENSCPIFFTFQYIFSQSRKYVTYIRRH